MHKINHKNAKSSFFIPKLAKNVWFYAKFSRNSLICMDWTVTLNFFFLLWKSKNFQHDKWCNDIYDSTNKLGQIRIEGKLSNAQEQRNEVKTVRYENWKCVFRKFVKTWRGYLKCPIFVCKIGDYKPNSVAKRIAQLSGYSQKHKKEYARIAKCRIENAYNNVTTN